MEERGRYRVGVSYGVFDADISFIGSKDALLERRAVTATVERRMSPTWTLALGAGASLGGTIRIIDGDRYDIRPGWLGAISSSWLLAEDRGRVPFVLFSLTIAASGVTTRHAMRWPASADDSAATQLLSFDARMGLLVGKTFWDVLRPYAGVRGFGGPILWRFRGEHVIGGDPKHFQLALGMSTALPAGTSLFAEVAPLGERGVTLGASAAF